MKPSSMVARISGGVRSFGIILRIHKNMKKLHNPSLQTDEFYREEDHTSGFRGKEGGVEDPVGIPQFQLYRRHRLDNKEQDRYRYCYHLASR